MQFIQTKIRDVILVEPKIFKDNRGYFMETYNQKIFHENGITVEFVQDNMSSSTRGTLRGLHYQLEPFAQGKLVRVTKGRVFDVAVDIRRTSPTFGEWVGLELSEENKRSLFIPPGFAHGFYVLSEMAEFTYKCTALYAPRAERGIIWNDPDIGIEWPLQEGNLVLSQKDNSNPPLRLAEIDPMEEQKGGANSQ